MLGLFGAYAQRTLPYRVPGVDSNDVLYASEPAYAEKLSETAGLILTELEASLAALTEAGLSFAFPWAAYYTAAALGLSGIVSILFCGLAAASEAAPPPAGALQP